MRLLIRVRLSFICLLAFAGGRSASAQCYQFSSGSAASLTINITNLPTPGVTSSGGFTSYQYPAFGAPGISESLTIGQTTYVGPTASTTISILIEFASSTSLLRIVGGVLAGPGLGNYGVAEIELSGAGDLLPNGLTAVLPPISSWGITAYMTAGSLPYTTYQLTSITNCSGASPTPGSPTITLVQNAEGGSSTIAPNTWVAIKGSNLAPAGDTRIWMSSDFINNQMPTQLDGVSVTMNGENAYVYYISPTQVNVLTPPDLAPGSVQVAVTTGGVASASFTAQAQPQSLSFFIFGSGPYVIGTHLNGTDLGPTSLYPGLTTPAAPGETVILYGNGFGPISPPVAAGSEVQSGSLPTLPVIQIGGISAFVQFAGLVSPGLYQFNVVVPASTPSGDNAITATYNGSSTQAGTMLTIEP